MTRRSGRIRVGGRGKNGVSLDVYKLKRTLGPVGATIVIAMVLLFILAQRSGWFVTGSDWETYHNKTFMVTYVVDGDTLHVNHPDGQKRTTTIRFWGIDTPEINHGKGGPPDQPFGREARDLAVKLADGKMVTLQLDPADQRGKYGRLLAYVILPDGRSLNEILIEQGLAHADMRFNHHLIDHYKTLEDKAKRQHKGMWAKSKTQSKTQSKLQSKSRSPRASLASYGGTCVWPVGRPAMPSL